MSRRSLIWVAPLVALLAFSLAHAQDRAAGKRGEGRHRGAGQQSQVAPGGQGQQDENAEGRGPNPGQMHDRMLATMKQQLGATDEQWKDLGPKVEKVMTLHRETRPMMGMGMMGARARGVEGRTPEGRGRGPQPAAGAAGESDIAKAQSDLRKAVTDKTTSPEDIKKNLAAYRQAREKATEELRVAQKDLKGSVDARQEAILVLAGLLE